jgi:hypothetical protein
MQSYRCRYSIPIDGISIAQFVSDMHWALRHISISTWEPIDLVSFSPTMFTFRSRPNSRMRRNMLPHSSQVLSPINIRPLLLQRTPGPPHRRTANSPASAMCSTHRDRETECSPTTGASQQEYPKTERCISISCTSVWAPREDGAPWCHDITAEGANLALHQS